MDSLFIQRRDRTGRGRRARVKTIERTSMQTESRFVLVSSDTTMCSFEFKTRLI